MNIITEGMTAAAITFWTVVTFLIPSVEGSATITSCCKYIRENKLHAWCYLPIAKPHTFLSLCNLHN